MNTKAIKRFLSLVNDENYAEQIKLLNMYRYDLLDDIHEKQKFLDQLDYMVYEFKNKMRKIRIVLSSIFAGNITGFMYNLMGGLWK